MARKLVGSIARLAAGGSIVLLGGTFGIWFLLTGLFALLTAVVFTVSLGSMVYGTVVPQASASLYIEALDTTITTEAYGTTLFGNSDRFLILETPEGTLKTQMADWSRSRSRTSLYLTESRDIVILGPRFDDYLISIDRASITRDFELPSDRWTYLGAFDSFHDRRTKRGRDGYRFILDSEQAECIPTGFWQGQAPRHRSHAYAEHCPGFRPPK